MSDKHSEQPLLDLNDVSVSIHGTPILDGVSFQLAQGKTLGIIGESGSGKSMTALSIMQLLPQGAVLTGKVHFAGQVLTELEEPRLCELRGGDIGMVFQEPMSALNPVKNIGDQVSESVRLHRDVSRAEAMQIAAATLERVGLPNADFPLSRFPYELSGGQRQRVVIAIAVACKPKLLIADEPTTALDVTTQAGILDLLKQLQRDEGLALILISHDLAVVSNVADNIVVMNKGCIVEQGVMREMFDSPKDPYTKLLFDASSLAHLQRHTENHSADLAGVTPLLTVDKLTYDYNLAVKQLLGKARFFRAVDQVSLVIHAGESVGLVGESGCGKSTLSKALLGLMPLHSGSITLNGESVNTMKQVSHSARRMMQVVFQDPYGSFNPRHKVRRLVSEPLHVLDKQVRGADLSKRVDEVLLSVGMSPEDGDKYIHEFSGGQRQRIAIARSLIIKPRIVILDEAVSALDVSVRAQVLELLDELAVSQGLAYLFISHDLSIVQRVTDRVLVMRGGRIVEQGHTRDVFDNPQHDYTKELIAAVPVLRYSSCQRANTVEKGG